MFALHNLGWNSFQQLCLTITREILGQTVEAFLDSRDGGRDAPTGAADTMPVVPAVRQAADLPAAPTAQPAGETTTVPPQTDALEVAGETGVTGGGAEPLDVLALPDLSVLKGL